MNACEPRRTVLAVMLVAAVAAVIALVEQLPAQVAEALLSELLARVSEP